MRESDSRSALLSHRARWRRHALSGARPTCLHFCHAPSRATTEPRGVRGAPGEIQGQRQRWNFLRRNSALGCRCLRIPWRRVVARAANERGALLAHGRRREEAQGGDSMGGGLSGADGLGQAAGGRDQDHRCRAKLGGAHRSVASRHRRQPHRSGPGPDRLCHQDGLDEARREQQTSRDVPSDHQREDRASGRALLRDAVHRGGGQRVVTCYLR
mmetsp:Transcript_10589/g.24652  ORF Transcript_10589/g.24652 Transcript_10589/m.24652 type:complete len:214 (+) Transcript_10589:329-970(+)